MTAIRIDDPTDPRLVDYGRLTDPEHRRRLEAGRMFIAEGPTSIERLLESGHRVRSVLVTPKGLRRLEPLPEDLDVFVADAAVLNAVVGFDLHRGAVAAAERRPAPDLTDLLAAARRLALLEGLNDPENLGAIARSARALGIEAAVIDPTCIDPYSRRTVRVSMGESLFLPTTRAGDWPTDLARVRDAGFEVWALSPGPAGEDLWTLTVPSRVAVLLGAEGPGLSPGAAALADRRVRIPIAPAVDSLNVGHAAAIAFAALGHLPRRASVA
ncbi:MAG: TrmH family RNA methyltransferase [Desertimonas sp.]